jgi:8-oxo-dGTP diphosphatase
VSETPVLVVAAVIERDGRLLICQRSAHDRYPLKWEFPGGKVEPGEDPRAALARELEEELALRAVIGEEILSYEYCYPERTPIRLIFFRVPHYEGEPRNRQFADTRWETPARLPAYDFVDGDREFVARLAGGSISFAAASPPG